MINDDNDYYKKYMGMKIDFFFSFWKGTCYLLTRQ